MTSAPRGADPSQLYTSAHPDYARIAVQGDHPGRLRRPAVTGPKDAVSPSHLARASYAGQEPGIAAAFAFAQRYLAMEPAAILAESPGNGFVDPSQVRQLKVERKWRSAGSDDDNSQAYLRIVIETTAGKTTYDRDGETPNVNDTKLLLSRTFGALVR